VGSGRYARWARTPDARPADLLVSGHRVDEVRRRGTHQFERGPRLEPAGEVALAHLATRVRAFNRGPPDVGARDLDPELERLNLDE